MSATGMTEGAAQRRPPPPTTGPPPSVASSPPARNLRSPEEAPVHSKTVSQQQGTRRSGAATASATPLSPPKLQQQQQRPFGSGSKSSGLDRGSASMRHRSDGSPAPVNKDTTPGSRSPNSATSTVHAARSQTTTAAGVTVRRSNTAAQMSPGRGPPGDAAARKTTATRPSHSVHQVPQQPRTGLQPSATRSTLAAERKRSDLYGKVQQILADNAALKEENSFLRAELATLRDGGWDGMVDPGLASMRGTSSSRRVVPGGSQVRGLGEADAMMGQRKSSGSAAGAGKGTTTGSVSQQDGTIYSDDGRQQQQQQQQCRSHCGDFSVDRLTESNNRLCDLVQSCIQVFAAVGAQRHHQPYSTTSTPEAGGTGLPSPRLWSEGVGDAHYAAFPSPTARPPSVAASVPELVNSYHHVAARSSQHVDPHYASYQPVSSDAVAEEAAEQRVCLLEQRLQRSTERYTGEISLLRQRMAEMQTAIAIERDECDEVTAAMAEEVGWLRGRRSSP